LPEFEDLGNRRVKTREGLGLISKQQGLLISWWEGFKDCVMVVFISLWEVVNVLQLSRFRIGMKE
jgi:hypothetical protein